MKIKIYHNPENPTEFFESQEDEMGPYLMGRKGDEWISYYKSGVIVSEGTYYLFDRFVRDGDWIEREYPQDWPPIE